MKAFNPCFMKSLKDFIIDYSFFSLSILLALGVHFYYSLELWKLFETNCINKEFLAWDPELRFITTLKMMHYLRNGDIFSYLMLVFDAPHWPSLRNVFESLIFFITLPKPEYVILITYCFYLALPISILAVLWMEKISPLWVGLFLLIFCLGLSQTESLQLYAFTGMMELQGAFFFTLVAYTIAKIYTSSNFPENKRLGWFSFTFTTFLFHTKYPYGYLLMLCLILLEVFLFSKSTLQYANGYWNFFKKNWYMNFRFWIVLIALVFLLLPKAYLTGKLPNYLRYAIVLFIVIDIFIFFYRTPTSEENARLHFLLKWVIFPILFWMLAQPDRIGSYSGQISHVESQGRNPGEMVTKDLDYYLIFVDEFLMNGFQSFTLPFFLFFCNLAILGFGLFQFIKKKCTGLSFYVAFLCLATIFELSIFTTNRLARHIYHLYPAMFLSIFFFVWESLSQFKFLSYVVVTTFLVIVAYPVALNPKDLVAKTEVCYTGYDPKDYLKPRWIEAKARELLNQPTIVLNEVNPYHVNKADTEYLIYRLAYEKRIDILFDPKRLKKLDSKWKELWIVGDSCKSQEFHKKKELWESFGFLEQNSKVYHGELACIRVIPRINP